MNTTIHIQRLGSNDVPQFQKLIALFGEVFGKGRQQSVNAAYLKVLLMNPFFVVYIAMKNGALVGGLTAYELPMYDYQGAEMFLYDIGVKEEFQQQGIGKSLLDNLKEQCQKNGVKELFVSVDEADQNALDFYHSTGGAPSKVVHFTYDLEED